MRPGMDHSNHHAMNLFYLILTLASFALAIAASNGKLGGISDAEAFRRATLTR
jgi:hypothetical protein